MPGDTRPITYQHHPAARHLTTAAAQFPEIWARNLDDLRSLVQRLTAKGVAVEFLHEHLTFTGEDTPMANLLLSVMGAFAEFERAIIRERQLEGIALAKQRGAYKGRKKVLTAAELERICAVRRSRYTMSPGSPGSGGSVAARCICI